MIWISQTNWNAMLVRLTGIEMKLSAIQQKEQAIMSILDDILAKTTQETDEIAAIKTYVQGLKDQLAAALAAGDTAKLQAIVTAIDANLAAEAAIVNTPSA